MRIREHRGFGHGLQPGTDHDINCTSCQREHAAGITPRIRQETSISDWCAELWAGCW